MIDALMMAYTVEMISIEKVVASVKRFSTFRASKELPFDLEDAMVFWVNKVWTGRHNQPSLYALTETYAATFGSSTLFSHLTECLLSQNVSHNNVLRKNCWKSDIVCFDEF